VRGGVSRGVAGEWAADSIPPKSVVGPVERELTGLEKMHELGAVVCGKVPGRARPDEITLFKSNGLAIEDVAAACKVMERAKAQGVGTQVPIFA
jgi:alanine dehydrogenase